MEKRSKRRAAKRDLTRALLSVVHVSGTIAIGMIAPNMPKALERLGMLPTSRRDSGSITRAREQLLKRGLLTRASDGYLELTPAGERWLESAGQRVPPSRPPRWDGRWRVLIFDVPERKKSMRERLRRNLIAAGFVRMQDSVWAYPYDCEDLVALLKADLRVGKDLLYLIVEEMEGDSSLRERFGLHS